MQLPIAGFVSVACLFYGNILTQIRSLDVIGLSFRATIAVALSAAACSFGTFGSYFPSFLFVLYTIVKPHLTTATIN
jgi:hypothetical protein